MNTIIALLIPALIMVESAADPAAIGDHGQAVGVLQIHPSTVADVNRITGAAYTLSDRLDADKSAAMCRAYLAHYGRAYQRRTGRAPNAETLARIWNGGPRGYAKTATAGYWRKVRPRVPSIVNGP